MSSMVRKAMRLPAVMAATGLSRSTIYAKIKEGKFPPPTKLDPDGRTAIWFEDQIAEIQQRAVERQAQSAA